MGVAGGLRPPS